MNNLNMVTLNNELLDMHKELSSKWESGANVELVDLKNIANRAVRIVCENVYTLPIKKEIDNVLNYWAHTLGVKMGNGGLSQAMYEQVREICMVFVRVRNVNLYKDEVDKMEEMKENGLDMQLINNKIVDTITSEEEGYTLTEKANEAIYILSDGRMISGYEEGGNTRTIDHRMVECLMETDRYDNEFWEEVHARFKLVMLVPETKIALVKPGQKITDEQQNVLNELEYKLELY